jgi:DNA-binding MarR family transcriptional regulator
VDRAAESDERAGAWPPAALGDRLAFLFKHAHARMVELAEPALDPLGVDGRDFGVLAFFAGEGSLSQQEAARRLAIDRTTMVSLIDGLEGKGLVERRPHPADRRKNAVALTAAGRDVLAAATSAIHDAEARLLAPLSPADAATLRRALHTLVAATRPATDH